MQGKSKTFKNCNAERRKDSVKRYIVCNQKCSQESKIINRKNNAIGKLSNMLGGFPKNCKRCSQKCQQLQEIHPKSKSRKKYHQQSNFWSKKVFETYKTFIQFLKDVRNHYYTINSQIISYKMCDMIHIQLQPQVASVGVELNPK